MAYLGGGVSLEGELSRLRVENQALAEDLAQCQADKEFVWSLWKRLQVASPDITQAIGMVIQREKEKAEIKDRKVLGILAAKDDKIDELQKVISTQGAEVSAILAKKMELSEKISHLIAENEDLKQKQDNLLLKVDDFEKRTKELEEKEDMARSLTKKTVEIDSLKRDKDDLTAIRDSQKLRLNAQEDQIHELGDEYNRITKENSQLKKNIQGHERVIHEMQRDVEHKDREMEAVRKEMTEIWENHNQLTDHASQQAHLIQQLRSLQTDTQKMLKNQEDAFTMESSTIYTLYTELKSKYANQLASERDITRQLVDHRQRVQEQDHVITELRRQVHDGQNRSVSTQASLDEKEVQAFGPEGQIEYRLQSMQTEIEGLKDRIKQKNRILHGFEEEEEEEEEDSPVTVTGSPLPYPDHSSTPSKKASSARRRHRSTSAEDRKRRTRSASPDRRHADVSNLHHKVRHYEKRLDDCRTLLKHRTAELEEMRGAHGRRLERLKALQTNHRLCRKQLKALEEEVNGPVKKRKKPKRTTDPKALQKENSDAVWNELTYFKTEHKNLLVGRMNLQEELDTLRVQAAQDGATIHELRTCLEQEKEELAFLLEQQRPSSPDPTVQLEAAQEEANTAREEAASIERRANELRDRLNQAQQERQEAVREKDKFYEEKRACRSEVNALRQQVADRRMEITDLKRDLLRAQREVRKKKKKEKQKPQITKQYQKVLNRSIQTMSHMFDDFDKEGWEEVSETSVNDETGATDITATTDRDSLGAAIAHTAHINSPRRDRQTTAEDDHVRRLTKRSESPERDRPTRRDTASSPITVPGVSPLTAGHHGSGPARVLVSKKSLPSPAGRQLTTLRQRITSLQKEVSILREAKNAAVKKESEQRRTLEVLQGDLQLANHRLASSRSTCQRLSGEVERLKAAKEDLETQVDVAAVDTPPAPVCTEQEYHSLQARLKTSASEVSKQLTQIKELKAENETLTDKIQTLTNKLNHTERDLSQKRVLVEDLKFKVKVAQENASTDTEVMLEAEGKIKQLAETNSRFKTQMESSQQRIAAVSREKRENEGKVIKLSQELEKKTKLVTELQRKSRELESALNQLERTAEQQLLRLAEQSETAMETAQTQLRISTAKLNEFNKFVKVLAHALVNSLLQARSLLRQQEKRSVPPEATVPSVRPAADPSLAQAQRRAADILNLSQSEVDDIMSVKASPREQVHAKREDETKDADAKKDKKWTKKWEKYLSSKKEFSMPMVELFMEKLEERIQLAAKLSTV